MKSSMESGEDARAAAAEADAPAATSTTRTTIIILIGVLTSLALLMALNWN